MNNTEHHRHQCECRWLLAQRQQRDAEWLDVHMAAIAKRRGVEAAQALRADCRAQWVAGNRGAWGDWR